MEEIEREGAAGVSSNRSWAASETVRGLLSSDWSHSAPQWNSHRGKEEGQLARFASSLSEAFPLGQFRGLST